MKNLLGYYQNFHQGFLAGVTLLVLLALFATAPLLLLALVTLSLQQLFSS